MQKLSPHSHPGDTLYPSGLEDNDDKGDIFFARWLDHLAGYKIRYNLYAPGYRKYKSYNANSTLMDFISTYEDMWKD